MWGTMNSLLLAALMLATPASDKTRSKWLPVVKAAAIHYELDWKLLDSVIQAESNWDTAAKSSAGAEGLAQLMPKTARWLGVKNSWDPGQNIWGSALYLRRLHDHYCDWRLALAAYNAGPKKVSACECIPDIPETQMYVRRVLRYWDNIEADSFSYCEIE